MAHSVSKKAKKQTKICLERQKAIRKRPACRRQNRSSKPDNSPFGYEPVNRLWTTETDRCLLTEDIRTGSIQYDHGCFSSRSPIQTDFNSGLIVESMLLCYPFGWGGSLGGTDNLNPNRRQQKKAGQTGLNFLVAETVGFEPTSPLRLPDFESGPL